MQTVWTVIVTGVSEKSAYVYHDIVLITYDASLLRPTATAAVHVGQHT